MRATQAPDIYHGPNCNQHRPRWVGSAEGDKDGDTSLGDTLALASRNFPPGTKVTVSEPQCPQCGEVPADFGDLPDGKGGWLIHWRCGCDFDWNAWAEEQFS